MSIRATNAHYLDAYTMYQDLYAKNSKASDAASQISNNFSSSANTAVSGILTTQGRDELAKALDAMKKAGYTRFTFNDVEDYRKKLEASFSEAVRSDLKEMGVDPDIEFSLVLDANGNLTVVSDHPDKAVVEAYFEDNPEMVDAFKHIQALSNLKKAQGRAPDQAAELTRNLKLTLQAEAVQAFFAATDNNGADYFSQIATFGSNSATSYLLGLNQSV
ncbi:MAG: hypothetical protein LIP28_04735 [Deltaproteobacteria bacterium]|nr:hypothetical protein [Deltaproteobacteria bacterium]